METGKCLVLADSRNSLGVLLLPLEDIYPSRWIEFYRERVDQMILRVSQSLKISQLEEGKRYWRNRTQFSVRNSELINWYQMGKVPASSRRKGVDIAHSYCKPGFIHPAL